jgi:hypothetical protein
MIATVSAPGAGKGPFISRNTCGRQDVVSVIAVWNPFKRVDAYGGITMSNVYGYAPARASYAAATPRRMISIASVFARSKALSSSGRPLLSVAISCAALAYCCVVAQIM